MTLPLLVGLSLIGLALIFWHAHKDVTTGWVDGWQEPKDEEERND
jgi:hypothetical protein